MAARDQCMACVALLNEADLTEVGRLYGCTEQRFRWRLERRRRRRCSSRHAEIGSEYTRRYRSDSDSASFVRFGKKTRLCHTWRSIRFLFPNFSVLHFPPMQFGADNSSPAFSSLAFSASTPQGTAKLWHFFLFFMAPYCRYTRFAKMLTATCAVACISLAG